MEKPCKSTGLFQHSCHNPNYMQLFPKCLALTVHAIIFLKLFTVLMIRV